MIHTRLIPSAHHYVKLIGTLALTHNLRKHKPHSKRRRDFPPPIHDWDSEASIAKARQAIINELIHRGETFETSVKVADQVIEKSRQKKGPKGGHKCPP